MRQTVLLLVCDQSQIHAAGHPDIRHGVSQERPALSWDLCENHAQKLSQFQDLLRENVNLERLYQALGLQK